MADNLDPLIREKLTVFGRRWQQLVLMRGACGAVITFLGALLLAATMDWLFILPEPVRWGLTAMVYLGSLVVFYVFCVRPLWRKPDARFLARQVERSCPELREQLLSAVELSDAGAGARWDSPAFRSLVQAGAVAQLRELRMENLLPPGLIAVWLRATAAVVVVCAALSLWGDGRQLMARALAPMANLDRVSRTKIQIVEPNPAELLAPLGDNLPVVVKITGSDPEKAWIELQPLGGRNERVQMSPHGAGEFRATIPVGAETLQYRIRAGDAITRLLTVRSQARPHVTKFGKIYQFPEYTGLRQVTVTEDTGDLKALEGTEVDLRLQVNQKVSEGELRVVSGGETNRVRLAEISPLVMTGTINIKGDATYSVHLVAAESQFENKFSPSYEIRPYADLVPRVTLEQPRDETVVNSEEIVLVQGSAQDDIGLTNVLQMFQVNGAGWTEVPLTIDSRTNTVISRRWDLLQLGVAPGDHLVTKLVAIDLKGSRAESSPVRLTVSAAGFDPSRVRGLLAARVVLNALEGAQKTAGDFSRNVPPAVADKLAGFDEVQRKQLISTTGSGFEEIERVLDLAADLVKEAVKGARPGRESSDLTLVGRVISRLKHERIAPLRNEIESIQAAAAAKGDGAAMRRVLGAGAELAGMIKVLTGLYRQIHSADEGDVVLENVVHLGREQERILKQAGMEAQDDPATWQRMQRRETAATRETTAAEGMFKEFKERLPSSAGERAGRALEGLTAGRTSLEKEIATGIPDRKLIGSAGEFRRVVRGSVQQLRPLTVELATAAEKARAELAAMAGSAAARIELLRKDIEAVTAAAPKGREAEAAARAKLQEDWQATVAELRERARLEESRREVSPQFAADATTAANALSSLRSAVAGANPKDADATLKRIEQAVRALEAANHLAELEAGLKTLTRQETWDKAAPEAGTARPKDAAWLAGEMKTAAADLKAAALPVAAVNAMAQAASARELQTVQQEMAARQGPGREAVPLRVPLEKLGAAVQQAQRDSQAAVNAARAELAAAAPKVSEQLAGLARTAEQLEKAVTAATQPGSSEEPRKLLDQQADLNRQVQEAMETIRRDANVQDFTKAEGRERARDADDAVAMLREPPPRAAEALRQATAATEPAPRAEALAEAAKQEQKLGATLQQLAKHFANTEAGKPEESRAGLRQAEADMGLKAALDEQYGQAGKLMELLAQSPEQMLAQLEQELARNAVMRKELQEIARDTLMPAREALQQAAETEKKLADDLAQAGKGGERAAVLGEQARRLAAEARDLGAKQVPQMNQDSTRAKADATDDLLRAQQALLAAADTAARELTKDPAMAGRRIADLSQPLQQASRDLQAVAAKAAEAVKTATQQAQTDAGKALQTQAEAAAAKAAEMSQQVEGLGRAVAALPPETPELAMAQAAAKQPPLATELKAAGMELQRAARHENRLGTAQADALQKVGEAAKDVASQQIPAAQSALAPGASPAAAQTAVQETASALEKQMGELAAALAQPAVPKGANEGMGAQPSAEQSKWMARALDRLDAAMNGSGMLGADKGQGAPGEGKEPGGQPGKAGGEGEGKMANQGAQPGKSPGEMGAGKPGGDPVGEALAAAAQEQMAAMRAARAGGQLPGETNPTPAGRGDGTGSLEAEGKFDPAALPQLPGMKDVNWAKLPPKVAQGLIEAQREAVAAEYRNQVDAYFRVIAEKAREKKR